MSTSTEDPPVKETSDNKPAEGTTKTAEVTIVDRPIKTVKSKKDLKNDPERFESPGINFNAKLIGIDDVADARGDKMCQESMYRLKIAVKQSGQHKQKIVINVSLEGIRIIDVRTHAVNHTHPVHRISFISRDITDSRAFGYVYGAGDGKHKFFAIKTEKAAEALVLSLRDLFQVVYEKKKKEVEEAKHKIEEPAPVETGTEAKEKEEPVYQVPKKATPVENGTDPTYQVPSNNQPVESETPDLLQMETELETIERRIEQIDTMEELFRELEAPPTTSSKSAPAGGTNASWANDFASLSQAMSQPQPSPMFSLGGVPFSSAGNPFPTSSTTTTMFPGPGQPFGAGQPYGAPTSQPGPFGQPASQFGGFGQQPFGGQPNMFQPPSVPPRTGAGFPGVQPNAFPRPAFGAQPQQLTPFPTSQQPAFPTSPGFRPPAVSVATANDPFGSDPFTGSSPFDEGLLVPARQETPKEAAPSPVKKDAFGDLVDIGGKPANLKPKDLFAELSKTPKKALNELKVEKSPSPKPTSPVGFQASGASSPSDVDTQQAFATDPFSNSENPFGTSDPFANDPFTTTGPAHDPAHSCMQDDLFRDSVFDEDEHDISHPDEYNIPLPQCPPPPLPDNIASHTHLPEPLSGPPPPPRPSLNTPPLPTQTPPLPPRPKSTSSDTSLNSLPESQPFSQVTPPLPPRPKPDSSTAIIPRPRPRPTLTKSATLPIKTTEKSHDVTAESQSDTNIKIKERNLSYRKTHNSDKSHCDNNVEEKISSDSSKEGANDTLYSKTESQKTVSTSEKHKLHKTSSLVIDPFVSTDPFASEDPFTSTDPFAHDSTDPFAHDPFTTDPFAESSHKARASQADPFTTVVTSPRNHGDADPFSVFDKKLSNDSFKFERSSSRKNKVKVSGQ